MQTQIGISNVYATTEQDQTGLARIQIITAQGSGSYEFAFQTIGGNYDLSVYDVPVLNVSVGVFTSDTSSVTDAVQNNIAFSVIASDSTTIMEVVGAAYPLQISVTDQTTINESVVAAEFAWIYFPNVSDTTKVNEHVQILKSNTPGRATTTDKLVNRTKIVVQPQANPPAGFEG